MRLLPQLLRSDLWNLFLPHHTRSRLQSPCILTTGCLHFGNAPVIHLPTYLPISSYIAQAAFLAHPGTWTWYRDMKCLAIYFCIDSMVCYNSRSILKGDESLPNTSTEISENPSRTNLPSTRPITALSSSSTCRLLTMFSITYRMYRKWVSLTMVSTNELLG